MLAQWSAPNPNGVNTKTGLQQTDFLIPRTPFILALYWLKKKKKKTHSADKMKDFFSSLLFCVNSTAQK